MRRLLVFTFSTVILIGAASRAMAQADAQAAFQQAKAAYQAGKFAEARDLAAKAGETDPKNPEVFLLLGKAQYQLGELDDALAAWKKTLALAPQEPLAAKMIESLQSRRTDVDTRIKLVAALLAEKLFAPAADECRSLLENKSLGASQRAAVKMLQAELAVKTGQHVEAQRILQELATLYPKQVDPLQANLLLGEAKLLESHEAASAVGIELLKKIVADQSESSAAARAGFDLLEFDLRQGVDPRKVQAMDAWLAGHLKHERARFARELLLGYNLLLARQEKREPAEFAHAGLSYYETQALAAGDALLRQTVRDDAAKAVADQLLNHLESVCGGHRAYRAVEQGTEQLLKSPLPRASRLRALRLLASAKVGIAGWSLDEQVRTGTLPMEAPLGKLPRPLTEASAIFHTISREFPAEAEGTGRAALAQQVRGYAGRMFWPDKVQGFRGPDAWAVDLAELVVAPDGDLEAVKQSVRLLQEIARDYAALNQPGAWPLAVDVSRRLIRGLASPRHPEWPGAMAEHARLLDRYALFLFAENVKAGRDEANAELSDAQKKMLDALVKLVDSENSRAPAALQLLGEHLKPWTDRDHWTVAEEAYAAMQKALPDQFRRDGELAVVKLWIAQVLRRDGRLAAAGLTVPRKLDPQLQKALERCYALQGGLEPDSAKLRQVRGISDSIVAHYRNLEYNDVAEAAIRVKSEKAIDAADQYAAYQLVQLHEGQARRETARLLEQYGAAEKIALNPALKAAIAAWCGFITERPISPLAPAAAEQVLGIARQYEQYGAFDVAAGIYADFAKFAAGVKTLSQGAPNEPSMAERALHSSAIALDAHARKLLAKAAADRKSDDLPPAKLSGEFAAAIDAYKTFAETYPDSRLLGETIRRVMAVGLEYSQIDAWDVADGVYADLQKSKLKLRRPERLEFARGLCQLGRAMPVHARQVLQAIGSTGLGEPRDSGERSGAEGPMSVAVATPPAGSGRLSVSGGGTLLLDVKGIPPPKPAENPANQPNAAQPPSPESQRDTQLLAMIQRQEASRSARVAQLGGNAAYNQTRQTSTQDDEQGQQMEQQVRQLSDAELARQEKALDAAYAIFQGIRKNYPDSPTVRQVRGEILVMIGHWRSLTQWQRSAALAMRFLGDNPTDPDLAKLRLEVARDRLAWASQPIGKKMTKQEMLAEVASRFAAARADLAAIVADFPKERGCQQEAQWDVANSFLSEARVIGAVSPTLTRGQFVRAARELRTVAAKYPNHPRLGEIPQLLWNVAQELENGGYEDESVVVWNELGTYDPLHPLAQQGAMKVAQTYQRGLKRPLKAAEAYMELNFIRGGNDPAMQAAIFQIGTSLKTEKRWVEAMQVLETFVNAFPRHPQAGQALTMVGQIHQTNEAWKDAIAAYRRVVAEYKDGQWVQEAKWAIAECTINLSQWQEAAAAYRDYAAAYPGDSKLAEANRRIEVLKDLARYQGLIDEKGQRKAFDAQFQIATIVRNQLANPVKGIIEYRKVVANWPESYVAASALYEIGTSYLSLGETAKARESLQAVAKGYATSPLAGAAMFMVGKSYEDEADKLATVTREKSLEYNKDIAQREAYQNVQSLRGANEYAGQSRIESLKKSGKGGKEVEYQEAANSVTLNNGSFVFAQNFAQKAQQDVETLTSTQLADRQDKINAALRKAIDAYAAASKIPGGAKADSALLQMATIYDQRLKDSKAAVETWLEIVRQFSGTAVAEDASWKLAQYYERERKYAQAIEAYNSFLRNYRRSPNAGAAQFAVAECYEHLGQWVAAMDSYNNYINNFADGPLVAKAKEQINWIKTYRL